MPNLKEIRTRISSVSSTKKITSAMKMVSAAKFKKAQNNLVKFRPFNEKIFQLVEGLPSSTPDISSIKYIGWRKEIRNVVIIVLSSNNSMCGAFNANIAKAAIQAHNSIREEVPHANITFYCLGNKGADILKRGKYQVKILDHASIDRPNINSTKTIFDDVFSLYISGRVDRVELVFNKFKNAATQFQTVETLLPIVEKDSQDNSSAVLNMPIIEPDPLALLERLLPYYLLNSIHFAILESSAAEHGARMTSMHQATENATGLLNDLVLEYNKVRQAAITSEILEIVSGANALKE